MTTTTTRPEPARLTYVEDPWNPAAPVVAVWVQPCPECGTHTCSPRCAAARDRAANRPCRCGYDLCGECMRAAHDGVTGPARSTTVPGVDARRD